ncbi:hypothetical protein [Glycomyces rhizosphaerae]|uniref:HTH cro/C1-type domain-containing protein n=1 Tax=Glycomyces rhizosphaerae TaxID=2054422 RepID=A0ABV7Q2I1_9ACTN
MQPKFFQQRLRDAASSTRELGDLLGIHPHLLYQLEIGALLNQPVHIVLELARHLDINPIELLRALNNGFARDFPTPPPADTSEDDAETVLAAIAIAPAPIVADDLAAALAWTLDRTENALKHAERTPTLGGPMRLRRNDMHAFFLEPRLDRLDPVRQQAVRTAFSIRAPLTVEEATVLYMATRPAGTGYGEWRLQHPEYTDAERSLKMRALLYADQNPNRPQAHTDVRYTMAYSYIDPRRSPNWADRVPGSPDSNSLTSDDGKH